MSTTAAQVIRCRAALLRKEGEPLTIEEITVDPPKVGEVRVRMVAAGICATDGHFVWGQNTDVRYELNGHPLVLGHEGAAIVESVGDGVTSVAPGDHVIPLWMPNCDKCQLCANPRTNYCLSDNIYTTLYHANGETRMKSLTGEPLLSFFGTSTFSEYSVLRESQVAKVNSNADLKTVCVVSCAVGTGYETAVGMAKVHEGSTCAVWGLGAVGLSAIMGCKAMRAKRIIGIDIKEDKVAVAKQLGCTEFINPIKLDQPIEDYLQKCGGIDYAFDCIGNKKVLNSAMRSLTNWGSLLVVGLAPRGTTIEVSVAELLTGRLVMGGLFGNQKSRVTNQKLVDMHVDGELPIEPLITHRFKLDQINKAFDLQKEGKSIRSVIEY